MANLSLVNKYLTLKTLENLQSLASLNLFRFAFHGSFEVLMNRNQQIVVLFNICGSILNDHFGDHKEGEIQTESSQQKQYCKAGHLPNYAECVCFGKVFFELKHLHADTYTNECLDIDSLNKSD